MQIDIKVLYNEQQKNVERDVIRNETFAILTII